MGSVLTPAFRVSFPNVFKPRVNTLNNQEEYSVMALFPKDADLSGMKVAAKEAIEKKWGAEKSKHPANLRSPFRKSEEKLKSAEDGTKYLPAGYEEGGVFMNFKSKQRPGVVDQKVQDIIDDTEIYAGCWVRASVSAYAYDQKGNRGVSFGLGNIQKVKDDDPLGGRTRPQDDFAAVETVDDVSQAAEGMFD
jgi:hypothetical protein